MIQNWYKTFKNNQKIRVVINGVHVITTAEQIVDNSILRAVAEIDRLRDAGDPCVGLAGTWHGKDIQVDLA